MVGKTNSVYHIIEDNNVQTNLSPSQYGFRAGVSTETALHEFVRRVEHCLVRKKPALDIFLDIVGAFDNVTLRSFVAFLQGLGMSNILTKWIENSLTQRTVHVELHGDRVKKGSSEGEPTRWYPVPFSMELCLKQPVARVTSQGLLCSSLCR